MAAVLSALSAIFCAVPALRRVEPVIASGPTTSAIGTSTIVSKGQGSLQAMPTVRAPARRASSSAAST